MHRESRSRTRAYRFWPAGLLCVVALAAIVAQGDFTAPPRYDGAGYAVLARSIVEGRGYRSIDRPDAPRHAHFPPGYPAFLALLRKPIADSAVAARWASAGCVLAATVLAWLWFGRIMSRRSALILGLALAVNWGWSRTGSSIQSEPLYELLQQAAILAAAVPWRRGQVGQALRLGGLAAACILTRHIAVALVAAVFLDLLLRRRWAGAGLAAMTAAVLVAPWLTWLFLTGPEGSQIGLLTRGSRDLTARVLSQAAFYTMRIPDQLTGPIVEVATGQRRWPSIVLLAKLWSAAATSLILLGWVIALRRPRRRLAGLIPLFTLAVLLLWPFTEAGRFLVPLIPCLLIGSMEGVAWLGGAIGFTTSPAGSRERLRRVAAILVVLISMPYTIYSGVTGRARAQDSAHLVFDAACRWIKEVARRPGPVLSRHPGEIFLATGRTGLEAASSERPGENDAGSDEITALIDHYQMAYLLVDENRYAGSPAGPLFRFVAEHPERVREVWGQGHGIARVTIYEVLPSPRPILREAVPERSYLAPSKRRVP